MNNLAKTARTNSQRYVTGHSLWTKPIVGWTFTGGGCARLVLSARQARKFAHLLTSPKSDHERGIAHFLRPWSTHAIEIASKIIEDCTPSYLEGIAIRTGAAADRAQFVAIGFEWGLPVTVRPLNK